MLLLSALIAASVVTQTPSMLADIAVACNDPANLAQTKVKLLEGGWIPASAAVQSNLEKEASGALDPQDTLTIGVTAFEKSGSPNVMLFVADEQEAEGFWMRSCGLRDPNKLAVKDIESVQKAFSLGEHEEGESGPSYTWELWDAKLTYLLYLDSKAPGTTALIIQKYGRD